MNISHMVVMRCVLSKFYNFMSTELYKSTTRKTNPVHFSQMVTETEETDAYGSHILTQNLLISAFNDAMVSSYSSFRGSMTLSFVL